MQFAGSWARWILLAALGAGGLAQGVEPPSPSAAAMAFAESLPGLDAFTVLSLYRGWRVGAVSNRGQGGRPATQVFALRKEGARWKRAYLESFEDAYNVRVEARPGVHYKGAPVVFVWMQYGAAGESLAVYGIRRREFTRLQTLSAASFSWHDGGPVLLAHPAEGDRPQTAYRWTGTQFVETEGAAPQGGTHRGAASGAASGRS
ncbi:hypothetical protein METESE_19260 [Mesoterricola sediminis]|uniref:DUF1579 domain-containing protein n=2 Tax=Mesoterricola sediminis TaxID=2927980 RepID=A0AA48HEV6_9BACT|nr:hypothetical protein METESE_19260 [Mesoterricola sediminis]